MNRESIISVALFAGVSIQNGRVRMRDQKHTVFNQLISSR